MRVKRECIAEQDKDGSNKNTDFYNQTLVIENFGFPLFNVIKKLFFIGPRL